jgi:hypothetical protein
LSPSRRAAGRGDLARDFVATIPDAQPASQWRLFHMAAVALNYFAYNFIKIHTTLRVSPAMAAGVTDRLFDLSDLVSLLIESEREKPRNQC